MAEVDLDALREVLRFEGRRVLAVRITVEGIGVVSVEPEEWVAILNALERIPELKRERNEARAARDAGVLREMALHEQIPTDQERAALEHAERVEAALKGLREAITDGDPATFTLTGEDFLRLRRAVKRARGVLADPPEAPR